MRETTSLEKGLEMIKNMREIETDSISFRGSPQLSPLKAKRKKTQESPILLRRIWGERVRVVNSLKKWRKKHYRSR